MIKLIWLFISVFILEVHAKEWDSFNNPYRLSRYFHSQLEALPLKGKLQNPQLGWPGNHWANNLGGIAHRWSAGTPQDFSYKLLSLAELQQMTPYELDELSPAEKFDIFAQNYGYPTVKKIFSELSPNETSWNGICHGYAPAALNHEEPQRVILTNPDGVTLTFYSSDVAGLLSYFYSKEAKSSSTLIGKRCWVSQSNAGNRNECDDLNAGAFHIVLANKLGRENKAFIADIDRYAEVWNHILIDYSSRLLSSDSPQRNSASGTVKRVKVETQVRYAGTIAPKFDSVLGTDNATYVTHHYEYFLELNAQGKIIGGEWISATRPDFIWVQDRAAFKGMWEILKEIYRPL
jgi:hypothetical protein